MEEGQQAAQHEEREAEERGPGGAAVRRQVVRQGGGLVEQGGAETGGREREQQQPDQEEQQQQQLAVDGRPRGDGRVDRVPTAAIGHLGTRRPGTRRARRSPAHERRPPVVPGPPAPPRPPPGPAEPPPRDRDDGGAAGWRAAGPHRLREHQPPRTRDQPLGNAPGLGAHPPAPDQVRLRPHGPVTSAPVRSEGAG